MQVEDIMERGIFTCDTRANLDDVARMMWDHDCGCVPIVNGSNKVMGLVTDRDVAMAAYIKGKRLSDIQVTEIMPREVQACEAGVSVATAYQIMRKAEIRRLPVVDAIGKLIGLVTWSDILRAAQRERSEAAGESLLSEVIDTLDAVSTHHR